MHRRFLFFSVKYPIETYTSFTDVFNYLFIRLFVSIIFYSMVIANVLEPLRGSGYIIAALVFLSVVCFGLESECDFPVWTNGCSVPLNLPFFYKKKFTTACNHHDVCYHCVSSARSTGIFCFFVLPYCLTYIQFCMHVHNHSETGFDYICSLSYYFFTYTFEY